MRNLFRNYLQYLEDERSLCDIRLLTKQSLAYALLNLRINWLDFKISLVKTFLGEK